MAWQLAKKLRRRAALLLAVLYALCVVTTPLALAFTDGTVAAHCLTADHHGTTASYPHNATHFYGGGSGAPHKTSDHDKVKSDCCGLFCVTAGAIASVPTLPEPEHATTISVVLLAAPGGHPTDRIDRPPRAFLSL